MIAYWHKAFLAGMNGSGKSELLNWLWSQLAVRRVLVDSKREWSLAGVAPVDLRSVDNDEAGGFPAARAEVDAIDWDQPIIHVRHAALGNPGSRGQLSALFAKIHRLPGPVSTAIHEAVKVSSAAWCPPGLREELTSGASREHGVLAASQRPRHVAKELLTEAQHVFLFPPLDVDDLKEARRGTPFLSVEQAIAWTANVPAFGYLWADRQARAVAIGDPLPNDLRLQTASLIRLAAGHRARPVTADADADAAAV